MRKSVAKAVALMVAATISLVSATSEACDGCSQACTFDGDTPNGEFGGFVSTAGDVDLDGYADVMIGDRFHNGHRGRVYVFSGKGCDTLLVLTGETQGDELGQVSGGGDLNGDGHPDLIVGAEKYGADDRGRVYVFSGLNGDTLAVFTGASPNDGLGTVSFAGDVNADGCADLLIGAGSFSGTGPGMAYVIAGCTWDTLFVFNGGPAGKTFGDRLSGAGDVDDDGHDDLIIGDIYDYANGSDAGCAYVFSGLDGDTLFVFRGAAAGDQLGVVSGAGDVSGDGHADLIVGARGSDANGSNAGRAYVFSGVDGDTLYTFDGEELGDLFGERLSGVGDVNSDGTPDIVIGSPIWGGSRGRVYVFSGASGAPLAILSGEAGGDQFHEVSTAGDVDGDNRPELLVGARSWGPSAEGRAYIIDVTPGATGETPDECWDFDGDSEGALPTGFDVATIGSTGDSANGGADGLQQVTLTQWTSPPNSLQLRASGTYSVLYRPLPPRQTGRIGLGYKIRLDSEPHNSVALLLLDDVSGDSVATDTTRGYLFAFTGDWNGLQMGWSNGTWHNLGSYDLNRWYEVFLDIDLDTESYDIYIDGALRQSGASVNQPGSIMGVRRLVLFHDNGTSFTSSVWFDDICVYGFCDCPLQCDFDGGGALDAVDLAGEIDIVFFGAADVVDPFCPTGRADFNADGAVDAVDLAFLIDHVFFGGPPPGNPCSL